MMTKIVVGIVALFAAVVAEVPQPAGIRNVIACSGINGIDETCGIAFNATACVGSPCSKLVVIFSGGEMSCLNADPREGAVGNRNVMDDFAANGWAAACLNIFETGEGSGAVPRYQEKNRLVVGVKAITEGKWASTYWTGAHLLLQGISHGASGPVIAMARGNVDQLPAFQGTEFTAGCFFDGTYNPIATTNLLATGAVGGRPCNPLYYRFLERYCPNSETDTHSECDLTTNEGAVLDNIEGVPPTAFHLRTWRITECGSAMRVCFEDMLPKEPQAKLCESIDSGDEYSCEFTQLPTDSHLTCHTTHGYECREWFDKLLLNRTDEESEKNDIIDGLNSAYNPSVSMFTLLLLMCLMPFMQV